MTLALPLMLTIAIAAQVDDSAPADVVDRAEPADAGPANVIVPPPPALLDVTWEGEALLTGRLAKIEVKCTRPIAGLTGTLDNRKVILFPSSTDGSLWTGLAPVSIEARKKPVKLAFSAVMQDGKKLEWKKPVAIAEAPYDERKLTVSKQFVKPSAKQRARAAKESKQMEKVLSSPSAQRLWRGSFAKPTPGVETSPFGTKRTYNDKKKSRHLGLDLNGATGDPIVASNRGRVALASDRFYSGGTVVLDHGEGLFSMYFHMSRIDVKIGDVVEKGQGLGAVGASGQVTGPHLHFSVKAAGLYVDPHYLLELDLSQDALDTPAPPIAVPRADAGPS
jgi:murein DD-endopeptidase MepM/ murein hydrolase activator NlpD